jgi:hypothetical protein
MSEKEPKFTENPTKTGEYNHRMRVDFAREDNPDNRPEDYQNLDAYHKRHEAYKNQPEGNPLSGPYVVENFTGTMSDYLDREEAKRKPKQMSEAEAREKERDTYIGILKGASFTDLEQLGFTNFAEVEALNGQEAYDKLRDYRDLEKRRQQVLAELGNSGVVDVRQDKDGRPYASRGGDSEVALTDAELAAIEANKDLIESHLGERQKDFERNELQRKADELNAKSDEIAKALAAKRALEADNSPEAGEKKEKLRKKLIRIGAFVLATVSLATAGVTGFVMGKKAEQRKNVGIENTVDDKEATPSASETETTTSPETEESAEKWVEGGYDKDADVFYNEGKEQKVSFGDSLIKGIDVEDLKTNRNLQEKVFQDALDGYSSSPKELLTLLHDMGYSEIADKDNAKAFNAFGNTLQNDDELHDEFINGSLNWVDSKVDGFRVYGIENPYGSYYMNEQGGNTSLAFDKEVHHGGTAMDLLDKDGNVLATIRLDCRQIIVTSEIDGKTVIFYLPQTAKKDRVIITEKTPNKPTTPDESTPETPTTPETPETPITPETPTTPEIPETPPEPETPEAKDESQSPNNNEKNKGTGGDQTNANQGVSETPIEEVTGDNGKNTGEADTTKNQNEQGNEFQAERPF